MGNCLVTKLKSIVENDELMKLGYIRIPFQSYNGTCYVMHASNTKPCEVKVYDKVAGLIKSFNSTTSRVEVSINSANGGYVEISNKYNIVAYSPFGDPKYYEELENYPSPIEYKYCNHLLSIRTMGELGDFAQLPANITTIAGAAYQQGDVLDYVKAKNAKGETSGSIKFAIFVGTGASYKKGTTKFNGVLVYTGTDYSSSSTIDQLHWNGSKCYILYANLTKIYCYGYTDGDIATNCASGGIWEGISVSNVTKVD